MRAEDPRSEPDIEWPGLAADSDGRSIVARSYRDIANVIRLLPRAVRERVRSGHYDATSPVVAGEVPTMNAKTSRAALARGQCTGEHCKADPAEVRPTPFTQFLNLSVGKAKGRRKKKIIWCRYADSGRISTPRRRSENSGRANARFMGKGNPTARCHRVAAIGRAPSK